MNTPPPDHPYSVLRRLLETRRSVRRFLPEPLPETDLERLLDAARWAPSPTNRQPWRFVAVREPERRQAMRRAVEAAAQAAAAELPALARPDFLAAYAGFFTAFAEAPLVLAALLRRPAVAAQRLAADLGTTEAAALAGDLPALGAALQNLLLAAHALGYGACWMSAPLLAAPTLRTLLHVPHTLDLAALVPVGRPAEIPPPPRRHPIARLRLDAPNPAPQGKEPAEP